MVELRARLTELPYNDKMNIKKFLTIFWGFGVVPMIVAAFRDSLAESTGMYWIHNNDSLLGTLFIISATSLLLSLYLNSKYHFGKKWYWISSIILIICLNLWYLAFNFHPGF